MVPFLSLLSCESSVSVKKTLIEKKKKKKENNGEFINYETISNANQLFKRSTSTILTGLNTDASSLSNEMICSCFALFPCNIG